MGFEDLIGISETGTSVFDQIFNGNNKQDSILDKSFNGNSTEEMNIKNNNFNLKAQNLGNAGVMESKMGLVAKREDLNFKDISLAEMYNDKAMDSRAMGGMYNFTLSDMYNDEKIFLATQGVLKMGGLILDNERENINESLIDKYKQETENINESLTDKYKPQVEVLNQTLTDKYKPQVEVLNPTIADKYKKPELTEEEKKELKLKEDKLKEDKLKEDKLKEDKSKNKKVENKKDEKIIDISSSFSSQSDIKKKKKKNKDIEDTDDEDEEEDEINSKPLDTLSLNINNQSDIKKKKKKHEDEDEPIDTLYLTKRTTELELLKKPKPEKKEYRNDFFRNELKEYIKNNE